MTAPVHILYNGHAMCGLRGPPDAWVDGATWVRREDADVQATCPVCIAVHRFGTPAHFSIERRVAAAFVETVRLYGRDKALGFARDAAVRYAAALTHAIGADGWTPDDLPMATAELLVFAGITRLLMPATDVLVLDVVARIEASNRAAAAQRGESCD